MEQRVVGVLGAGQLGRMFVEAAARLNVQVKLLDVGDTAPAKQINYLPGPDGKSQHIDGSFADPEKIRQLASQVDVLTIEIEHVDATQLQKVLDDKLVDAVHPLPPTIALIQDKYLQKVHLAGKGLPLAEYVAAGPEDMSKATDSEQARSAQITAVADIGEKFGFPLMLKSRTQAYDGKGNYVVKSADQASAAVAALGDGKRGLYAEKWAPFEREVAVMVVRSATGEVRAYPAVETVHKNSICHTVFAPLRTADPGVEARARKIAEEAVATFGGAGVFGVEMFLMPDGELLINEIAPRPHNSGHYTIEAADTSQYENHVRAILGLPLGSTALKVPSAAMINILGLADSDKDDEAVAKTLVPAVVSLDVPGTTCHLYGKAGCRKGRKMGHITIVGQSDAQVRSRLHIVEEALDKATELAEQGGKLPSELTLPGVVAQNASASASASKAASAPSPKSAADFSHPQPLVGIIMGSDSDLPVMMAAAEILKKFDVPFELSIVSAHRTPDRMRTYARSAPARGLRAIIAGAGGAAHLPGMVAAQTALPVIGVPVKGSTLDGVDSLHSIVQMPRGIPVATVAINNSTNAALLAIRILAAADPSYLDKMQKYMEEMENEVNGKIERLANEGWEYTLKK
ncbi:Phosphoribosylaminoimidazole carboxylase PurE domain protein [Kalmanozyma brasiliensis GHG001]|uniref:Phosphoribosylaminoimidazole carboxylase n=1 Tax=Kalmanozyma brasiliensis (strain GHG001) TaxID=1365824 RepID=V5EVU5_KALBG|nr:Phosphoribosylaminoimidazole carboxylase PurE domain protein [Kalmanozyma brasiliensis GHG001]EST06394.1 Phosphoribosylaminoimidazole carboxylase PurE domain protein [Kalmanozyma brasiliensis GHG001]